MGGGRGALQKPGAWSIWLNAPRRPGIYSCLFLPYLHVNGYFDRILENVLVLMIVWEVTYVQSVHLYQVRNLCTYDMIVWDEIYVQSIQSCTRYLCTHESMGGDLCTEYSTAPDIYVHMRVWEETYVVCTNCTTSPCTTFLYT